VNDPVLLREGARGDAVRDLRARLADTGITLARGDVYDDATTAAVRAFQEHRGLRVDGICGPETWGRLIESGFHLGDRLLYLASPMVRGDDVGELQRRLNGLGFDAGRQDAIFGPETEFAVRAFQRNAGLTVDGMCGPATRDALDRVDRLADGSVANVRERDTLRRQPQHLDGLRVFLASDPALATLAKAVARALYATGAIVGLDTSGDDPSTLATEANRFEAAVFVALATGALPGIRCAYFANPTFRSEGGFCLARRLSESLAARFAGVEPPAGRTYRLLRETRMAAVICELAPADDARAMASLVAATRETAYAIAEGIQRGVEEPVDAPS
jgi:N-acetylmuramoyl-L-alanine amidase